MLSLAPLVDPTASPSSPNVWRYPESMEGLREGDVVVGPYGYGATEEYWTVTMQKDPDASFVDVLAAMVGPNGPFRLPRESLEQLNEMSWIRMQALWKIRIDQALGRGVSQSDVNEGNVHRFPSRGSRGPQRGPLIEVPESILAEVCVQTKEKRTDVQGMRVSAPL